MDDKVLQENERTNSHARKWHEICGQANRLVYRYIDIVRPYLGLLQQPAKSRESIEAIESLLHTRPRPGSLVPFPFPICPGEKKKLKKVPLDLREGTLHPQDKVRRLRQPLPPIR